MKKLLLSIVAMIFAIGANAEDFTFDFNDLASYGLSASDFTKKEVKDGTEIFYNITTKDNLSGTISNGKIVIKDVAASKDANEAKIWYYTDSKTNESVYQYRTYKTHTVTISMADGSKISAIKGNGSTILNYSGDAVSEVTIQIKETAKLNSLKVTTGEGGGNDNPPTPEIKTVTVAEAINIINGLENGAKTDNEYIVTGKIEKIDENFGTTYGNATFTMEGGLVAYRVLYLDKQKVTDKALLAVGDEVSVQGKLQKYFKNDVVTPEMDGYITKHTPSGGTIETPEEKGLTTVADFLAAKDDFNIYEIEGKIVDCSAKAEEDAHKGHKFDLAKYGNFELEDATGSIYIYGLLDFDGKAQKCGDLNISAGDIIRVKGTYTTYNGLPQIKNAQIVEIKATAISNATANVNKTTAIFNLAGQKVSADYKGIAIKNGKKVVLK